MRNCRNRGVAILAAALLAPLAAGAQSSQPVVTGIARPDFGLFDPRPARMLVLDASGSMWGRVGSEDDKNAPRRAQLAAEFVEKLTEQLSTEGPARTLGMVRFGYQFRHQDTAISASQKCADVEIISPPNQTAAEARSRIAHESGVGRSLSEHDYNPKGRTALTQALERAAQAAPKDGATLVVVTDLEEEVCAPDPCLGDGRANPQLAALLMSRNIRVRYVIAAGLVGRVGARAKRFAACFGAEFKVLESSEQAGALGRQVALSLMQEARPPRPPPVAAGSVSIALQDKDGRELAPPGGSQIDLRAPQGAANLLGPARVAVVSPGQYQASLTIGTRRWKVDPVKIAPDERTEVRFIVPPAILRARLVDSDHLVIDDQPDTVWEISSLPDAPSRIPNYVKGARLSQPLPAGKYLIKAYLEGGERSATVELEAGQEIDLEFPAERR